MKRVELVSLEKLIGLRLNAVTFVMDYIQLTIDDGRLNVFVDPIIRSSGNQDLVSPSGEFRNALIDLIPSVLSRVEFENRKIILSFSLGTSIIIPYSSMSEEIGGEAILYQSLVDPGDWWVINIDDD